MKIFIIFWTTFRLKMAKTPKKRINKYSEWCKKGKENKEERKEQQKQKLEWAREAKKGNFYVPLFFI
jgi:hypothetical protein